MTRIGQPGRAMAGKAYSSAASHSYLRRRGIATVIPVKEDQKKHPRRRDPLRQARLHVPGHGRRRLDPDLATRPGYVIYGHA